MSCSSLPPLPLPHYSVAGPRPHSSFSRISTFLQLALFLSCISATLRNPVVHAQPPSPASCPLNFTILEKYESASQDVLRSSNNTYRCVSALQALHLVLAEYLRTSSYFLVPASSADACWNAFNDGISALGASLDVRALCNGTIAGTASLGRGRSDCHNVQTVDDFKEKVPQSSLSQISSKCNNGSLLNVASCSSCIVTLVTVTATYLPGSTNGSVNTCQDVVFLYAAGVASKSGPWDDGIAFCLFNIANPNSPKEESKHLRYVYGGVGAAVTLLLVLGIAIFFYIRHRKRRIKKQKDFVRKSKGMLAKTINSNSSLQWFTMDEIKAATGNFARANIIGTGGFGNVYKGVLPDGTEIAVKRFKNCSVAGDADFVHEVEVISSVRHRNLVGLRGCCVHTSDLEGHQRIIVYDFISNGSLHDQLFSKHTKLDWPTRQNIALGMARGLAYLHQDSQPAIIHRDIKASNILLDGKWNALVADFGLAKFTPDGATHVTTRVAGTYGYVAPEYALYGQLTEKSDVYSFGIVLLELLTRRKALSSTAISAESQQPILITDWAWALVKKGRIADILDPTMENKGPSEVVERYVLVALLCAHPQVPYRPSIDQVLKILESDQPLPSIPDRPIPLTSGISVIEKAIGGADAYSSRSGFQSFSSDGSSVQVALT